MLKKYKRELDSAFDNQDVNTSRGEVDVIQKDPDTIIYTFKKEPRIYFSVFESESYHDKFKFEYCHFEKKYPIIKRNSYVKIEMLRIAFIMWLMRIDNWKEEFEGEESDNDYPKLLGYTDLSEDTEFSTYEKTVLEQDVEKILEYVKTIGLLPERMHKLECIVNEIKEMSELMGKFSWKNYAQGKLADAIIDVSMNAVQFRILYEVFKFIISGQGLLPVN